jgi:hypothetical protein
MNDREVGKPWCVKVTEVCRGYADLRCPRRDRLDHEAPVTLIQFRQDVVKEQDWGLTCLNLQQVDLGEPGRNQLEPLLSTGAETAKIHATDLEQQIISMGPDGCHSSA